MAELTKPLHVQVAEALGWSHCAMECPDGGHLAYTDDESRGWGGVNPEGILSLRLKPGLKHKDAKLVCPWPEGPDGHGIGPWPNEHGDAPLRWAWSTIPHYDTDWSATGPLIEKYQLTLIEPWRGGEWEAINGFEASPYEGGLGFSERESGPTPLIAVCHLILALKAAGKL